MNNLDREQLLNELNKLQQANQAEREAKKEEVMNSSNIEVLSFLGRWREQREHEANKRIELVMREMFNEREARLINNCQKYAHNDPAGLPGHNLMIIVSKLLFLLEEEYLTNAPLQDAPKELS